MILAGSLLNVRRVKNIFVHKVFPPLRFKISHSTMSYPDVFERALIRDNHQNIRDKDILQHQHDAQDFGIGQTPKRPEFADYVKRLTTFDGTWPQNLSQTAEAVAKAGFLYEGKRGNDECVCFFCGGKLYRWNHEDDPFVEHARHFPRCGFIHQKVEKY